MQYPEGQVSRPARDLRNDGHRAQASSASRSRRVALGCRPQADAPIRFLDLRICFGGNGDCLRRPSAHRQPERLLSLTPAAARTRAGPSIRINAPATERAGTENRN